MVDGQSANSMNNKRSRTTTSYSFGSTRPAGDGAVQHLRKKSRCIEYSESVRTSNTDNSQAMPVIFENLPWEEDKGLSSNVHVPRITLQSSPGYALNMVSSNAGTYSSIRLGEGTRNVATLTSMDENRPRSRHPVVDILGLQRAQAELFSAASARTAGDNGNSCNDETMGR